MVTIDHYSRKYKYPWIRMTLSGLESQGCTGPHARNRLPHRSQMFENRTYAPTPFNVE